MGIASDSYPAPPHGSGTWVGDYKEHVYIAITSQEMDLSSIFGLMVLAGFPKVELL